MQVLDLKAYLSNADINSTIDVKVILADGTEKAISTITLVKGSEAIYPTPGTNADFVQIQLAT